MSAARVRHPRFNGYVCIVDGCQRVEYKHGICRRHWDQVPISERMSIMLDAITAASQASKRHDAVIEQWARNYKTGRAAAGR